jgi:dimethylhistidine N-methyltransferase
MVSLPASTIPGLPEAAQTSAGFEVYRGLTSRPKTLSPWLFYDAAGSRLFEQITELDEYYVTRTERDILARHAPEIIAATGNRPVTLIELGAGTATKTGLLLRAAVRRQHSVTYHPIDVSANALAEAKQRIEEELPGVTVQPQVADYTEGLGEIEADGHRRVVLYIGSSIGNFDPPEALQLLRQVRRQLAPGDALLLGVDLVKDRRTLLDAYDDAAGVTAAFNKNVLNRINREFGSNFNLRRFRHRARWNEEHSRIEMHLESLIGQCVLIPALDLEVKLARGETIHTENSYKYTVDRVERLIEAAGFRMRTSWSDPREWFGEYLAVAV